MGLKQPPLLKGSVMYVAVGSMLRSCVMQGDTTEKKKKEEESWWTFKCQTYIQGQVNASSAWLPVLLL